jgi:hypothetical protein
LRSRGRAAVQTVGTPPPAPDPTREHAMRKLAMTMLLAVGVCAQVSTAGAQFGGVALRWNSCFADTASRINKIFACDTNAGSDRLVGSFSIGAPTLENVTGNEIIVDLGTGDPFFPSGTPIPEWWKFKNAGSCRQTALSMTTAANPEIEACPDWAAGPAVGLIGAYVLDNRGPGTARLLMTSAAPMDVPAFLTSGVEYFSFALTIRHDKTVGAGACGGCDVVMWLVFNSVNLTTPVLANDLRLSGPLNGTDANFAIWAPAPVPTRRSSWSAVKSLYR